MSAPQSGALGLQTSFLGDWAGASNALTKLSKELDEDLSKINVSRTGTIKQSHQP